MSLTQTPVAAVVPEAPRRDATIDAVRAASLIVVVVLHSLMVGVELAPDGGLHTSVALSGQAWFTPATWLLQIMPLFFIAGGFASLSQWRRLRARGEGAARYVAGRVQRLAVPAVIMVAMVGGVLLLAKALGADPSLLEEAGLRIGQPLWFLAVYLGVTALVPAMAWLHENHPKSTLVALALGMVAVDVASSHGALPVGYLNFALVWLLMQQLGFILLDGTGFAAPRRQLLGYMLLALAALVLLVVFGWSPDMLYNLNPPTTALALLGAAQFFALQLVRPHLDAATRIPWVGRFAAWTGLRAMRVYLWHMPVILSVVVVLWAAQLPLPAPHSGAWWATRVPWLVLIGACVIPATALAARLEDRITRVVRARVPRIRITAMAGRTGAISSVVLSIAGTATALLAGLSSPWTVVSAVALLSGGLAAAAAVRGIGSPLYSSWRYWPWGELTAPNGPIAMPGGAVRRSNRRGVPEHRGNWPSQCSSMLDVHRAGFLISAQR